jgi:hypothetical protein
MPDLKRPMYGPNRPKGPTVGKDVAIAKFGIHRYEMGLLPKPENGFTENFGRALQEAVEVIQKQENIQPTGNIGQATFDIIWDYLDDYRRLQYKNFKVPPPKPPPVKIPDLGPIYRGPYAVSIMQHSLTHRTSGVPFFPAFDDGWVAGRDVLAPEDLEVYEQSGSAGGDAFFCRGASGIKYWFGHLVFAPPTGKKFLKGEKIGDIAWLPISLGSSHVHCGIDARPLIGHELIHRTDYRPGAPKVGTQLREALSLT